MQTVAHLFNGVDTFEASAHPGFVPPFDFVYVVQSTRFYGLCRNQRKRALYPDLDSIDRYAAD
jgi:hypothetical protein